MLTLHYAPDNASLIVRLALEEIGAPYRTALVDRETRAQDSPAYRALNPAGLIPVLETPDGPIFETGAILLWLADRHPGAGLGPDPHHPARASFLKWLFFIANTAHPDLMHIYYPDRYVGEEGRASHRARMIARMHTHFGLIDTAARTEPALFALPSVLAAYALTLMRWSVLYPEDQEPWCDLAAYPALSALAAAQDARPATQRAADAEGLGPAPFADPQDPDPPEGSAT
ncbi:MAG: glutathione S-transferase family protein [Gemmobacter sp.]